MTEITPTTTELLLSPASCVSGDTVRLTATIRADGSAPVTGRVLFADGSLLIGTAPVRDGSAEITIRLFSSGAHTLVASFVAAAGFAPSQAVTEASVLAAASVTLTGAPDDAAGDGAVDLVAWVRPADWGAPGCSGTVAFDHGDRRLGEAALVAGRATLSTVLPPGRQVIVASYGGDERYGCCRSAPLELSIGRRAGA